MANRTKLTQKKKGEFLEVLADTANVSRAAKAVGISRRHAYTVRSENLDFATAWDEAVNIAIDTLEQEARRRAYQGVDEPVFYQGNEVGYVRKYSDTLLMFLLKGNRPEKYKDRMDMTSGDKPLQVVGIEVARASRDT